MKRKQGFTLIELLVVIAIIGLLLAVIIPALRTAKRQATGIVCMSNLNSLSKGWYMYQNEYDGNLIGGSTYTSTDYRWVEPPMDDNGNLVSGAAMTHETRLNGIIAGTMWPYIESTEVYHCPSDRQWLTESIPRDRYRTYAVTGLMNGEDLSERVINFPSGPKTLYCVKEYQRIVAPGNKHIFVEENAGQDYNLGSWVVMNSNNPDSWWDPLAIWHNDRSTLGFADGHAEKHHWLDRRTIELAENWISSDYIQPDNPDL